MFVSDVSVSARPPDPPRFDFLTPIDVVWFGYRARLNGPKNADRCWVVLVVGASDAVPAARVTTVLIARVRLPPQP